MTDATERKLAIAMEALRDIADLEGSDPNQTDHNFARRVLTVIVPDAFSEIAALDAPPAPDLAEIPPVIRLIEDTSWLSQGVPLADEMLTSIAISLKRIANASAAVRKWADDREAMIRAGLKPTEDMRMVWEARECAASMEAYAIAREQERRIARETPR